MTKWYNGVKNSVPPDCAEVFNSNDWVKDLRIIKIPTKLLNTNFRLTTK